MDLERSIPSLVDGLKPGQRKVLFTCFKRNLVNKEIKVAQLAGSVAELSAYHHGEVSTVQQEQLGYDSVHLVQRGFKCFQDNLSRTQNCNHP